MKRHNLSSACSPPSSWLIVVRADRAWRHSANRSLRQQPLPSPTPTQIPDAPISTGWIQSPEHMAYIWWGWVQAPDPKGGRFDEFEELVMDLTIPLKRRCANGRQQWSTT